MGKFLDIGLLIIFLLIYIIIHEATHWQINDLHGCRGTHFEFNGLNPSVQADWGTCDNFEGMMHEHTLVEIIGYTLVMPYLCLVLIMLRN